MRLMRADKEARKCRAFRALTAMGIAAVLWLVMMYALSVSEARMFQSPHTPILKLTPRHFEGGLDFIISSIWPATGVSWSYVTIRFEEEDTTNEVTWDNLSRTLLKGEPYTVQDLGWDVLGDIVVRCSVTDRQGDGQINKGDKVTVTGEFSQSTTYRFSLWYEVSGGLMGEYSYYVWWQ